MMTVFVSRQDSIPSSPRSLPTPESLKPPNGVLPSVQSQQFTQTVPACSLWTNLRARSMLGVTTPAPRPQGRELALWMTSSSVLHLNTLITGPKISSRAMRMPSSTPVKMVGLIKQPFSPKRDPPVATVAPSRLPSSMNHRMRSNCSLLTTAPCCEAGSSGSPTLMPSAMAMHRLTTSSQIDSWMKVREPATQLCPLLPKTEQAREAAKSRSASGQMMLADFPPSSSVMGFRFSLCELRMMMQPTSVEPVKETLSIPLCWATNEPVSPHPGTMLTTPGGNPASLNRLPSMRAVKGVCSAGLRTMVQPAARAGAIFQVIMRMGQFQGMICPTTPIGSLRVMPTKGCDICTTFPLILSAQPAKCLVMETVHGMSSA